MSTTLKNTYNPSQLVSLDIMNLLREMETIFLKYTGTHGMSTYNDGTYVPGKTVSYQVAGVPPITRGELMKLTPYEQRQLFIKADPKRFQKSASRASMLTDDIFYMKPELVTETISAPTLRAMKEHWELEAMQYSIEHAPIIPTFGAAIDQELSFPNDGAANPKDTFTARAINWLKKLRYDLILPLKSYSLILNTMDYMVLSNSLENIFNQPITSLVVKSGAPPQEVSDFSNECSPYLGKHLTELDPKQARGPLVFVSFPTSDENPIAVLKNMTDADITLKAGDIIYYKAQKPTDEGIHWIQNTVKRPVPDSRYAFVVTSDLFIEGLTDAQAVDFLYEDVVYKIPKQGTATVSLSHKPIFAGYHQNCSRQIVTGDKGDQFFVLKDHYKNVAINPNYFMMKSFKIPPMNSIQHSYVDDKKTGIKILISQDGVMGEGQKRGNVFDAVSLCCFGAVAQNLFTLPSGVNKK